MHVKVLFFIFVTNILYEVGSVNLDGAESSKKYVPCNLGLLHFDKLRENYWKCTVHFGVYANMRDAVMSIVFKNKVNVFTYPNNYFTVQKPTKYSLVVSSKQFLLEKFIFNVSTENWKKNDSDVPVVISLTLNNVPLCNHRIRIALTAIPSNLTHRHSDRMHAHVCGRRPINHTELVTVRAEAQHGDWPWHVAIFLKDRRNVTSYHCGGNVISRTGILTAAHCVSNNGVIRNINTLAVVAGVSNLTANQLGRQTPIIQQIVMHPAYQRGVPTSDLAIIKVKNIDFTDYVQPICVWGPAFDKYKLYYKEATMVGFGLTERNRPSKILRSTHVKVQNDSTCTSFMVTYKSSLNDYTFCAGNGPNLTANPLNGDSGGGLVFSIMQPDHKNTWFLRGVLSKCFGPVNATVCDPRYYVVYTDVGPYYGWIYYHADLDISNNVMVSYMN